MSKAVDGPTELGNLLSELMVSRSWQTRMRLHQVFAFWDDVVGSEIARHAQPQVIRGSVLWVGVSDPIWMQQLQFERQYLLEALNSRLDTTGQAGVQQQVDLRLTELRLALDLSLATQQKKEDLPSLPKTKVDPAKLSEFTGMLESITDQGLKQTMVRVWLALHRGHQQL